MGDGPSVSSATLAVWLGVRATQQPTLCLVDKWTISVELISMLFDFFSHASCVAPLLWPRLNILTTVGVIVIKFCKHIHSPQRMKATDFGDTLIFIYCHHELGVFSMKGLSNYWIECLQIW